MTFERIETVVVTAHAAAIVHDLKSHIEQDHNIEVKINADGFYFLDIEDGAFRVAFKGSEQDIRFILRAPNKSAMLFLKEEIIAHVCKADTKAGESIRWTGEKPEIGDLPPNFHILSLVKSEELHPGLQRVVVDFPDFAGVCREGSHLRLLLPCHPKRPPKWPVMAENGVPKWPEGEDRLHCRFMTIADFDTARGQVVLDIVRHRDGIISKWAQTARPGDRIGAMGPSGGTLPPQVPRYLLGSDLSGLPSLARFLHDIPKDSSGNIVVCAPRDFPVTQYLPETPLNIRIVRENETADNLLKIFRSFSPPDYAWFVGEFQAAQSARTFFREELKLGKGQHLSVAYWRETGPEP